MAVNAREYLEKANHYQLKPEKLFEYFAGDVPNLVVLYQKVGTNRKPLLSRSNRPGSKYVIAFTDEEATDVVRVHQPECLEKVNEPALSFLLKAYRSNAEGLMFNPGLNSRFFVVRHQLLDWIRYYAIHQFINQTDTWVIRSGDSILKATYQPGFSTVVIYTSEQDAQKYANKTSGSAVSVKWNNVFEYLERLGATTLYVNYGLPEAFLLNLKQVQLIRLAQQRQDQYMATINPEVAVATTVNEKNPQSRGLQPSKPKEEEKIGDWEVLFSDEEPLIHAKDVHHHVEYHIKPPTAQDKIESDTDETSKTTLDESDEKKEIEDQETITIRKQTKPKSKSVFNNAWDEDDEDGFVETIPRTSLLFRTNNKESEQVEKEEPEPKKQTEFKSSETKEKVHLQSEGLSEIEERLQLLEMATNDGQGMANGWEVCRALADLKRIWVIMDMEGKMVILASQEKNQIADFFTTESYAQSLIDEAHKRNPTLPQMAPRLISTKKLFRALAPTGCIIWINRGSRIAWTSIMGDTLPYIMQLMAQKE